MNKVQTNILFPSFFQEADATKKACGARKFKNISLIDSQKPFVLSFGNHLAILLERVPSRQIAIES